ncbi:MAG TPA: tRNA (guanosine(37)-N1)-methyltransferase TrmD, partial [Candidatus Paceibacterota bacterium]|nr:tRNA (guanosine(37)-N1)-methyltransferase TrmD [Candidatus Paceibacterota bacterium]
KFDIITIFPDIFSGFLKESLISKALHKRLISIRTHYLRKWTTDRHQTVDGKPYGGGPGLVMKVEPIAKAVKAIKKSKKSRVILFSPRGKQFDQATAKRWAKYDQLVFICGRYEGVDERVADHIADEVVSVGPYVLNGGEVAAMAVIEAVARLVPGFMHDADSQTKEDHPQYTKPEVFGSWRVPKVLLSGDHAKIAAWRLPAGKAGKRRS